MIIVGNTFPRPFLKNSRSPTAHPRQLRIRAVLYHAKKLVEILFGGSRYYFDCKLCHELCSNFLERHQALINESPPSRSRTARERTIFIRILFIFYALNLNNEKWSMSYLKQQPFITCITWNKWLLHHTLSLPKIFMLISSIANIASIANMSLCQWGCFQCFVMC